MAHDVLSLSEKGKFLRHCICCNDYVHGLLNGGVEAAI